MRGVRRTSRTSDPRTRVCALLVLDPAVDAAALRSLRRSAAVVARDQPAAGHLSSLPPAPSGCRSRRCRRHVRRRASCRRARDQVRRSPLAGETARRLDATALRFGARGGRRARACSPSSIAPAFARVQPGARPGPASRPCGPRAQAHARDTEPDRAAGRAAAPKHAGCIRAGVARARHLRKGCRAGGRCEHDGRDDRRLRARADRNGRAGGTCGYGSASRDAAALNTSAAIASLDRSPSSTTQPCPAACRL